MKRTLNTTGKFWISYYAAIIIAATVCALVL